MIKVKAIIYSTCLLVIGLPAANACDAKVKVLSTGSDGDKVVLSVRVDATDPDMSRTVFYNIFAEVRTQSSFGGNSKSLFMVSGTTLVQAGDEASDDEVEYYVGTYGHPISPTKIKSISVSGCYPSN
jgi:hypothetical protein